MLLTAVAVLPWTPIGLASVALLALAVALTPTVILAAMGDPWRPRIRARSRLVEAVPPRRTERLP